MKNCTLQEIQPPCTTNHFRRFVAVRQVVLERGLFGDLDIVGLYAKRFHCRSPDCPSKGRVNGPL